MAKKTNIALDIFDITWQILCEYPPAGLNVTYMNLLATSGRQAELLQYMKEFHNGTGQQKG